MWTQISFDKQLYHVLREVRVDGGAWIYLWIPEIILTTVYNDASFWIHKLIVH